MASGASEADPGAAPERADSDSDAQKIRLSFANSNGKRRRRERIKNIIKRDLSHFENQHGAFLDVARYQLGAFHMMWCVVEKLRTNELTMTNNAAKLVFEAKQKTGFIDPDKHDEYKLDYNRTDLTAEQKGRIRELQFDSVNLTTGDKAVSFEEFANNTHLLRNLCFSKNDFETDFIYFADLLSSDCNLDQFRAQGVHAFDVFELKQHCFDHVRRRIPQAQPRLRDFRPTLFTARQLELVSKTIENQISRIVRRHPDDVSSLLQHIWDYKHVKLEYDYQRHAFSYCMQRYADSMGWMKELLSRVGNSIESSPNGADTLRLLERFFGIFELTSSKLGGQMTGVLQMYFDLLDSFKKAKKEHAKRRSASYKQDPIREADPKSIANWEIDDPFERLNYGNITENYRAIWKSTAGADSQSTSKEIGTRINEVIGHMQEFHSSEGLYAKDLAHLFCLFKFFNVCTDSLTVPDTVKREDLAKFVEYYSANKSLFEKKFSTMKEPKVFQKVLVDLAENQDMDRVKKSDFFNLVRSKWNFMFNEKVLAGHVFIEEYYQPLNIFGTERQEFVSKVLDQIRDLVPKKSDRPDKRVKASADFKIRTTAKQARKLCQGLRRLTHRELLTVSPTVISREMLGRTQVWKYVIQQLLDRNGVDEIDNQISMSGTTVSEQMTAVYLLSDSNCRKALVRVFPQSRLAIPLGYYEVRPQNSRQISRFYALLYPLCGLSFKFETRDQPVAEINPFFHPSSKFAFLETSGASPGVIHELVNGLFHGDEDVHRLNHFQDRTLQKTVYVSFAVGKHQPGQMHISDLSMVTLGTHCFGEDLTSDNYNQVMEGPSFMIQLCDVVVLLTTESDHRQAESVYRVISEHNSRKSQASPKMLLEIVQSKHPVDTATADWWHKKIELNDNIKQVKEHMVRLVEFQKLTHGLGRSPTSLFDIANRDFQGSDTARRRRIKVDLQNDQFSPVICKVRELTRLLRQSRYDYQLQDKLHQLYTKRHTDEVNTVVRDISEQKNNYFGNRKSEIRSEQMQYLQNSLLESPVMTFLGHLLTLSPSQKLQYMWMLELLIKQRPIRKNFAKERLLQVRLKTLVRELQHVYEVLHYFVHKLSSSDPRASSQISVNRQNLRLLPRVFAELFKNIYPIELFNGEHVSVPDTWLGGVMEELELLAGTSQFNPRISVMTVVGLQSSGKSTFLNNLFNLSFAATNDKCTSGSNAVMLPVAQSGRAGSLGRPDYLIVIDTEGIGSPENLNQALKQRTGSMDAKDTTMLLFNIGVSIVSVINSMKEFGSEMVRIVALLMRSLMDLDECKVNPMMSFVFQCVENSSRTVEGLKKNSIGTLNQEFARTAKTSGQSKSFDSVVRFCEDHQVFTLPEIVDVNKFSLEYTKQRRKYKQTLLSSDMLFSPDNVISFKVFRDTITSVNNHLILRTHTFDRDDFIRAQTTSRKAQFEVTLRTHIKAIVVDKLKAVSITNIPKYARDPKHHESIFGMIKTSDKGLDRFKQALKSIVQTRAKISESDLRQDQLETFYDNFLSRYTWQQLHELVYKALFNTDQALPKYLVLVDDAVRMKNSLLQIVLSRQSFLDEFYSAAIESDYIEPASSVQDYLEQIKPLVVDVLSHMSEDKIPGSTGVEFFDAKMVVNGIWDEYDRKLTDSVRQIKSKFDFNKNFKMIKDAIREKAHYLRDNYRKKIERLNAQIDKMLEVASLFGVFEELIPMNDVFTADLTKPFENEALHILTQLRIAEKNTFAISLNNKCYKLLRQHGILRFEAHQQLMSRVEAALAAQNILRNGRRASRQEIKLELDVDVFRRIIAEVFDLALDDTERSKGLPRGPEYYLTVALYGVYLFRSNFEAARAESIQRFWVETTEPKKFGFQKFAYDFDGQKLNRSLLMVLFLSQMHLQQSLYLSTHRQLFQPAEFIKLEIKKHMESITDPLACLKSKMIDLLTLSKSCKSPEQKTQFADQLVYFATNIGGAVREHALSLLQKQIQKNDFGLEINEMIDSNLFAISGDLQNLATSLKNNNFGEIKRVADYFCGIPRRPDYYSNNSIRVSTKKSNGNFKPRRLRKIFRKFNDYFKMSHYLYFVDDSKKNTNNLDALKRCTFNQLESNINSQTRAMSEYKQSFLSVFKICGHKCPDCSGVCVGKMGHHAPHSFCHVSRIFSGKPISTRNRKESPGRTAPRWAQATGSLSG